MTAVTVIDYGASGASRFEHLAALLKMYDADCVFDVGAHVGEFGTSLRDVGYSGPIVSFEPVNDYFNQLEEVAARDPKWSVHRAALGRDPGYRMMNVVVGTGSSFLPPNQYAMRCWPEWYDAQIEEVLVWRLSDIIDAVAPEARASRPFLKLDTQGYDIEVFRGVGERIRDFVGLQCELSLIPLYDGMPTIEVSIHRVPRFGVS
jgi:FkbM family methyltransferase